MKRFALPVLACALVVAIGCGPMQSPLPQRFDPELQKDIDSSWNRAFSPADKLAHQDLLDVMVGTQAYQFGVDTFMLRAEKRFVGGKVVMEVGFDRARPDDDRFMVSVYDTAGKLVRTERYAREEIDNTYRELFPKNSDQPQRADFAERWNKITALFPQAGAEKAEEAPKPRPKG